MCIFLRHYATQKGEKKTNVKALPPMNGYLSSQKQIVVSSIQDNSASTEETSASSGFCQCRCTCGGWWRSIYSNFAVFTGLFHV